MSFYEKGVFALGVDRHILHRRDCIHDQRTCVRAKKAFKDGAKLLDALYADTAPTWLREIPAVQTLRRVCQYDANQLPGSTPGKCKVSSRYYQFNGGGRDCAGNEQTSHVARWLFGQRSHPDNQPAPDVDSSGHYPLLSTQLLRGRATTSTGVPSKPPSAISGSTKPRPTKRWRWLRWRWWLRWRSAEFSHLLGDAALYRCPNKPMAVLVNNDKQ